MKKAKHKIFLIEDEIDIMHAYKTALEVAGMFVEAMNSGKVAIEKIKEVQEGKTQKPALILLDLVLPDINGLEILYAVKKNEITKDVPVFILSNYSSEALLNIQDVKPEKFLVKVNISAVKLVELVKEQIG